MDSISFSDPSVICRACLANASASGTLVNLSESVLVMFSECTSLKVIYSLI